MKKLMLTVLVLVVLLFSCRKPYNKPDIRKISPSQTAYLIPLLGDTNKQDLFKSEELLAKAKVATKEVQIPKRWVQTGRRSWQGNWRSTMDLILVERKPETREWTENDTSGTSSKNEGVIAESRESISFMARMNCTAQINADDSDKFLYLYNNKSLNEIMDTEIRALVESSFVEECADFAMSDIQKKKKVIINIVRAKVIDYFKMRGITITVLGYKGDFSYLSKDIQQSIDAEFKAKKEYEAQLQKNKTIKEKAVAQKLAAIEKAEGLKRAKMKKAEGDSYSKLKIAEAEAKGIKLIQEQLAKSPKYIELVEAKKWNGAYSETLIIGEGGNNLLIGPLGKTQ
jgi:regulator of protease activity HflC (stomatin/prohibitin superfamily)